jgi:F-type H+-transporting ATPase subunit epsilon
LVTWWYFTIFQFPFSITNFQFQLANFHPMKTLTLEILTQEKHLLTETVTGVTAMTQMGEITVLPDHIPLFARLGAGELTYEKAGAKHHLVITGGFIDISDRNIVTILADSAVRSEEINLHEVEKAIESAKIALQQSKDKSESIKIEMELRLAVLKANVARKRQISAG